MAEIVGKDASVYKRATCYNCASIVQYTLSEVRQEITTDYTGGRDYNHYITCPCCHKKLSVRSY